MTATKQRPIRSDPWEAYESILPCADCPVRACSVCADVREQDRVRLQRCAERVLIPPRHVVNGGNGLNSDMLTLVAGVVMAFVPLADGPRQVTGFHFPGDILDWPRDRATPRLALQSLTPVEVCRIEGARVAELCHSVPELADRLLMLVSARIDAAREHVTLLGRGTAEQRVAWFLLELSRRTGNGVAGGATIDLPMSRADIGDYLGLEVETVSRVFSRLRSEGVLSLETPKQVVLRERGVLASLAGTKILNQAQA